MTTTLFRNQLLSKDTPQAIFHNRGDDGAVVTVRFCNTATERTRIAIAITSTQSLPVNQGEYIDFGTAVPTQGTYEVTGLIVPANFFIVAYSTRSGVTAMCSGYAMGTIASPTPIPTTTPAAITGTGLVYHYDQQHLFGLDPQPAVFLPDAENRTTMSAAVSGSPTYVPSTQNYSYNGTTQWWTSTDTLLSSAGNLHAVAGKTWTLEAWFRFPVTPVGTRAGNESWAICSKGGGIGGGETFTLFVGSATDTTLFPTVPYICYVGLNGGKTQISTGPVNDNIWRQAVITWDGTTSNVYLNGAFRSAAVPGPAVFQESTWTIGSAGNGTAGMAFEGQIGPIRIYNRALSAGEITVNFNYNRARFGI